MMAALTNRGRQIEIIQKMWHQDFTKRISMEEVVSELEKIVVQIVVQVYV